MLNCTLLLLSVVDVSLRSAVLMKQGSISCLCRISIPEKTSVFNYAEEILAPLESSGSVEEEEGGLLYSEVDFSQIKPQHRPLESCDTRHRWETNPIRKKLFQRLAQRHKKEKKQKTSALASGGGLRAKVYFIHFA